MLKRSATVLFTYAAAALALTSAVGCHGGPALEISPPPLTTLGGPPPSGATGCNSQRWVGAKTITTTCPIVAGWNEGFLFSAPAPAALADDCVYAWGTPAVPPTAADIAAMQASLGAAGVVALTEDCVIVGALSGEPLVNQAARPWLRDSILAGAGALPTLPANRHRTPIRLAVADTSPTSLPGVIPHGNSDHGYSVGWLAQQIGCPEGLQHPSCLTTVATNLALPYISKDTQDDENGGYFGTPTQVAKAIHQAVHDWRGQAAFGQPRLVVNLSLGWQPYDYACPAYPSPSVPAPTQGQIDKDAVFGALIEASCNGAIIVAAAGNHPGGPSVDPGPTCPAAWEAVRAPTEQECEDFLGSGYTAGLPDLPLFTNEANPTGGPPPLVYGVGGVDHTGKAMPTTRPGSLGRLAAIGLHGVAGASDAELAAPLSGSSVAAALVSGAAAALWSYAPGLTASEIMSILQHSGVQVPAVATDLRNPAITASTKRVSLCLALSELCSTDPDAGCSLAPCPALPASTTQNLPIPSMLPYDVAGALDTFYGSEGTDYLEFEGVAAVPPNEQYQGLAVPPWSHPQPIEPTCGGPCAYYTGSKRLVISINPAYDGPPLRNPALILRDAEGLPRILTPNPASQGKLVSLSGGLHAGDRLVLLDVAAQPGFVPVRATLVFRSESMLGEAASVTEEILLSP